MLSQMVATAACTSEQSCQLQGHFSLWHAQCLLDLASKPGGEALAKAAGRSERDVYNRLDQWLPRGCLSLCLGHCHHIPHCPDLKITLQTCPVDPLLLRWLFLAHSLLSWVLASQLSEPQEQKLHLLTGEIGRPPVN